MRLFLTALPLLWAACFYNEWLPVRHGISPLGATLVFFGIAIFIAAMPMPFERPRP